VADYSAETIPSKVYEYLAAGRPILGLVHRNVELAGMLTGLGHIVAEAADAVAVRDALSEIHRRWEAGALKPLAGSPCTIASAVDRLIAIAEYRDPV
ncbi:MAG: glycosyltransferase family 4 protein, partial [Desulfobacteria bacterium]